MTCAFCSDSGRAAYDGVWMCRWHLILLYLGLNIRWTD